MKKYLLLILTLVLAFCFLACNKKETKTIKVGASSTPHALILEQTKPFLETKGYKLEIVVFDDYVLPNLSLENNELDANYFQHEPYLNEFNKSNNTHIVSVFKVHFEPMGIYAGKKSSLDDYKTGDKIVVPSDKSNYDRAVELLKVNGIEDAELVLVEAQNIPLALQDCDFAVINGNYALASNVLDKCLVTESKTSDIALTMANIIAVKKGNENNEKIKALIEALKQTNVEDYIKREFGNSVISIMK